MKRKIDTFWYWFLVIVSFVVCYMFTCATRTKAVSSNYFYEKGNSYGLIRSGEYIYNFKGTTYYFGGTVVDNLTFNPEDGIWTSINIINSQSITADYMWDDGENLYYSSGTSQKVLNFSNMTWENKTWNGLVNFAGNKIWTDGVNIYCSNGTSGHYILDKETSTWNIHTWPGYYGFTGLNIWKDVRGRIFSLTGSNFYKLNDNKTEFVRITTSTGLSNGNANYIWTDRTNVYHSSGTTHYVFDHDNLKWIQKGFGGNPYFYGSTIWYDNVGGIYHTNTYTTLKFDYTPSVGGGYTEEDLNAKYEEGFEAGKNSVDITTDNLAYAEQYLRDKLAHEEIYDVETVSALIQYYNQMLVDMENGWNADLEFLNNILAFTENEIIKIYDGTLNFVMEPEQKNQYYQNLIMQQLELLISIVQEDSYNEGYQEGQASIDITSDNEAYAEQVIQDKLDKNQLFDAEYVFNVIQNAEDKFYAEGFEDGKNSIDITSNDAEVIQNYITNNNYHTNTDYLNYGNQKYQEGQNSIDITSNDAQVIQDYITLNKMKTEEDYLYYGAEQRREGYFTSYDNFKNAYDQVYSSNNYMTGIGYMCETYTSGAYSCSEAYKGYLNDLNNVAVNSVDITSNDDEVYNNGRTEGMSIGYQKANEEGKVLGGFIPNLLGGFGSFFLTIMNIDILGFNLLSIFGIAITIGIVIIILKFMRG